MSSSPTPQRRVVLRSTSGYWLVGVATAVMIFLLGDAAIRGFGGVVATAAPWMALVLWVMYLVLIRPALIVETDLLRVVNPFADHDIAWEAIAGYETKFQLNVVLKDGVKIGAWGGPKVSPGRPRLGARNAEPAPHADEVVASVRADLGPLRSAPLSATHTRLNVAGIAVTAVLVLACVLTVVL